ncbi:TetR/AcrR family transcriptional regulator [Nocardia higoensis]|uniref:TetR/AcrR family transcriptional regulator n=1 Tax=Nocardia higoensis TaxID=228599 RepID=UPI000592E3B8|nr:TetR family transcriptional regulator [Nocardia higoensis]
MSTADRRTRIADAAVTTIAGKGLRALTHRALDTALDLPPGSVSYYFRTRDALLTAVAERITQRSRTDFETAALRLGGTTTTRTSAEDALPAAERRTDRSPGGPAAPPSTALVARGIGEWLDRLLAYRRDDLLARHALILDGQADPAVRDRLASSLFSVDRARELFSSWGIEDNRAAEDFVAVLEGAVFDRFAGRRRALRPGSADSVDQLTTLVENYLRGVRGGAATGAPGHRAR